MIKIKRPYFQIRSHSQNMKVLTSGMGLQYISQGSSSQYFLHQGMVSWKTVCPGIQVEGMVWGMIQARGFYCALHFSYYYISLTSDHQALDLGDWGPLLGEHNLTGNCHFKSISTCSGCQMPVLPTHPRSDNSTRKRQWCILGNSLRDLETWRWHPAVITPGHGPSMGQGLFINSDLLETLFSRIGISNFIMHQDCLECIFLIQSF